MNSKTFTSKIIALFKNKAVTNGFTQSLIKVTETAKGNITLNASENVIFNFARSIRRNLAKDGTEVRLRSVFETFSTVKFADDLLAFVYNDKDEKVILNEKARQSRLNAFGTRIKNTFAPALNISADEVKDLNLKHSDILEICRAVGKFAVTTPVYTPKVKVIKATTKPKAKAASTSKPKAQPQPTA